ncbi:SRPBCC family protein [uncultured Jatrophihabitans sp.]|uniref:SRPBCC family protein n=1 Tax=uncultured Jatrophihabitans sp. TaxID=1610747 RepID=UPI0035CA6925
MSRTKTVSQSVVIDAPPEVVFAAVSDPTQTGRWSPENRGARLDGDGELAVGSTFVGRNRRGWMRWVTRCRVTAFEPASRFAFDVEAIGVRRPVLKAPIASWSYDLTPDGGGTRVVETWVDGRSWGDRGAALFDKVATRSTFAEFNTRNIRRTLDQLKQTLESRG